MTTNPITQYIDNTFPNVTTPTHDPTGRIIEAGPITVWVTHEPTDGTTHTLVGIYHTHNQDEPIELLTYHPTEPHAVIGTIHLLTEPTSDNPTQHVAHTITTTHQTWRLHT